MKKAILIHLAAFLLASLPLKALAFDYDVDWPFSDKTSHTLAITINGCETRFRILNEDFDKFAESKEALIQALDKAMKRANNGCKN